MKRLVLTSLTVFMMLVPSVFADSIEGYWKSINEDTHKVTAIWKLEIKNNELYGTIVNFPDFNAEKKCIKCEGDAEDFYNKPILGSPWIHLTEKNEDNQWEEGYIIDSKKGKKYDAKLWVEEGKLKVRGYIGFFFRTQEWQKATAVDADPVQTILEQ